MDSIASSICIRELPILRQRVYVESTQIVIGDLPNSRHTKRYEALHGGRLTGGCSGFGSVSDQALQIIFILNLARLRRILNIYSIVICSTPHTLDAITQT